MGNQQHELDVSVVERGLEFALFRLHLRVEATELGVDDVAESLDELVDITESRGTGAILAPFALHQVDDAALRVDEDRVDAVVAVAVGDRAGRGFRRDVGFFDEHPGRQPAGQPRDFLTVRAHVGHVDELPAGLHDSGPDLVQLDDAHEGTVMPNYCGHARLPVENFV